MGKDRRGRPREHQLGSRSRGDTWRPVFMYVCTGLTAASLSTGAGDFCQVYLGRILRFGCCQPSLCRSCCSGRTPLWFER